MKNIIVIAKVESLPEHLEYIQSELLKLVTASRQDTGVIKYDLHQNINNPCQFVFYEIWESEALLEEHEKQEHLKAFIKNTEQKLKSIEIEKLHKVEA
ncbi:antibiotic biosynthesis monooxygenase [Zooshikella marina]|uniref:putative quinol monooxygenase n=1 Tax=Zooshikella ganghwensis TaxID=202772 RepID=UPI001BAE58F8|nr:putative quinol monooxygenase [Zooshikella ganghwensis]MBU2704745.1 antibiotic biosynthesis monooxygenase [Zooshikella ganghwensis]